MAKPGSVDRSELLDVTRGVAVLSVVAYHCFTLAVADIRPDGAVGPAWSVFGAGSLGVDLFFVLSGFLLVGSWRSSRLRHDGDLRAALVEYGRRRALRILPAYWVSLAVLVPLAAPALLHTTDGLGRLALLATLQQYLVKELPGEVNLVYWSLTTEVHFYLLLPLLAAAVARYRIRAVFPALVALAVAWRLWAAPAGLPASWIFGRLDQFAAGMVAAGLVATADAGRRTRPVALITDRRAGWVLGSLLAAVALYHGARFSVTEALPGAALVHSLVGILIAGLLARAVLGAGATSRRRRSLARPVLAGAGQISFSLYLWHYPILDHGLRGAGLTDPAAPAISVIAGLGVLVAAAMAVSVGSYHLVERPFLERKKLERVPAPEAAVAAPAGSA